MRAACNEEKFERARKRNLINNNQLTYARPRRHKHRNHVQRGNISSTVADTVLL